MEIYVAGASKEMERVKRVMKQIREAGHEITFDWVAEVEKVGMANPSDLAQRKASARSDVDGVIDADVILVLHPAPGVPTAGMWFEMGVQFGYLMARAEDEEADNEVFDLSWFLAEYPTFISYEKEIATGPCIFDALFETKPILDADILSVLEHHRLCQEE